MQLCSNTSFPAKMQEASSQTTALDFYSTPLLVDKRSSQLSIPSENEIGVPPAAYSPSQLCIRSQLPCTEQIPSVRPEGTSICVSMLIIIQYNL